MPAVEGVSGIRETVAGRRNGPSYVSGEFAAWLAEQGMTRTHGRPYHPMTRDETERHHRAMKNQILLENYNLPGELEAALSRFVGYYNQERYQESLDNLTPTNMYYRRGETVLSMRQKIKRRTLEQRHQLHYQQKAA